MKLLVVHALLLLVLLYNMFGLMLFILAPHKQGLFFALIIIIFVFVSGKQQTVG